MSEKSCEASIVCKYCDYQASSSTVLKAHIARKHKYDQKVLEELRDASLDILLENALSSCTLNEYSSQKS